MKGEEGYIHENTLFAGSTWCVHFRCVCAPRYLWRLNTNIIIALVRQRSVTDGEFRPARSGAAIQCRRLSKHGFIHLLCQRRETLFTFPFLSRIISVLVGGNVSSWQRVMRRHFCVWVCECIFFYYSWSFNDMRVKILLQFSNGCFEREFSLLSCRMEFMSRLFDTSRRSTTEEMVRWRSGFDIKILFFFYPDKFIFLPTRLQWYVVCELLLITDPKGTGIAENMYRYQTCFFLYFYFCFVFFPAWRVV